MAENANTAEKVTDDPGLVSDMIEELGEDDVTTEDRSSDTSPDKGKHPELVGQMSEEFDDDEMAVAAESAVDSTDMPTTSANLWKVSRWKRRTKRNLRDLRHRARFIR